MMMDDIYFSDPVECPDCHKRCELGSMIWLNGHCTCPQCYENSIKRKEKQHANQDKS
jgi:hypothetical protein